MESRTTSNHHMDSGAAYFYILWGSLLFIFAICHYLEIVIKDPITQQLSSISWIVFPFGGILSYIKSKKEGTIGKEDSVYDTLQMYVWGTIGLCLGITSLFSYAAPVHYNIAITTLLFGMGTFIIGGVSRFYPFLFGGGTCILLASYSLQAELPIQYLLGAFGMLASCILPGIALKVAKINSASKKGLL